MGAGTNPSPSRRTGFASTRTGPIAGMVDVVDHVVGEHLLVVEELDGQLTPAAGTPWASKAAFHSAVERDAISASMRAPRS